jgi:hypothetical protein
MRALATLAFIPSTVPMLQDKQTEEEEKEEGIELD